MDPQVTLSDFDETPSKCGSSRRNDTIVWAQLHKSDVTTSLTYVTFIATNVVRVNTTSVVNVLNVFLTTNYMFLGYYESE